jgi:hypothetical protein
MDYAIAVGTMGSAPMRLGGTPRAKREGMNRLWGPVWPAAGLALPRAAESDRSAEIAVNSPEAG